MALRTQTKFDLSLLSLCLISQKLLGLISLSLSWLLQHFVGPVSRSLMAPTYIYIYRIHFPWPCGPKHILTWVYFPSAWFLQFFIGVCLVHTYIYSICFSWPAGPTQNLTCVHFPSAWFLQNLLGLVLLRLTAPTSIYDSFPLVFWSHTNFDLCSLSLSLVSP